MNWLFKEEPSSYNFDSLVKDKKTVWSGVRNPLAQQNLRAVKKGDRIFYYHTGDEKAVVGIAKALSDAYPDPASPGSKLVAVDVGPVRKLKRPVTLHEIKADPVFKNFPLVKDLEIVGNAGNCRGMVSNRTARRRLRAQF